MCFCLTKDGSGVVGTGTDKNTKRTTFHVRDDDDSSADVALIAIISLPSQVVYALLEFAKWKVNEKNVL